MNDAPVTTSGTGRRTGDRIEIAGDYQYRAIHDGGAIQRFWHQSKLLLIDRLLRPAGGEKGTSLKELKACADTAHYGRPILLEDREGVLAEAYAPAPGSAEGGITVVFVQPDGVVAEVVHAPRAGPELTEKVRALRSG